MASRYVSASEQMGLTVSFECDRELCQVQHVVAGGSFGSRNRCPRR